MANRRPQPGNRRMDFGRNDRNKNFRSGVSPWQGGGPGNDLPNLLPLAGGSTEATLALASNIINLLQPRQNPVPSLLDMPMRRDFGPNMGRYDRGYPPNRMGNQGNFRRTGNYNRAGERINTNRKPFRPNDGPRQPNKNAQRKEADPKPKVKASDEKETEGEASKEQKEAPKTRYDDINPQLLRCHICNKSMWDGRSFENHLSGRAHAIMMQKTAESYALTADTMRQEFKIREIKRTRKTGQHPPRDFYCAMCDMYAADGAIHRTTVGHRKLKKYLHPTCAGCHKEMPTRIELDEHRLTVEHLREMQNKQEVVTKPKPEVMVISTLNMEQMYLREDPPQRRRFNKDDNDDSNKEGDEIKKEADDGEAEDKPQEEDTTTKKPPMDTEDTVLDYNDGDDLSHLTPEMVPAYSTERGVGASFLQEFRCYQCKLCRKLLDSEETAEVHLRTWRHHRLFVRLLAEKSGKETPGESNKRPHNSDDTGNWKRRKTDDDNGGQDKDNADNGQGDDNGGNDNGDNDVQVKSETKNDEEELLANGEQETANEDDLEDWENTVDEILQNEDNEEPAEEPAEEQTPVEEEPEPAPEPEPEPDTKPESPAKVARTPRGRGRGRRRY